MVLKMPGDGNANGGDTALRLAAHTDEADGMLYSRDGLNYLVVADVLSDFDIQNRTHEDYGNIPSFSIPDPE